MALFYVSHYEGFVGHGRRTRNIREAKAFRSFDMADKFAKNIPLTVYAILQTPEQDLDQADELRKKYGHWGEHETYTRMGWVADVYAGDTSRGYWEWVAECIEIAGHEMQSRRRAMRDLVEVFMHRDGMLLIEAIQYVNDLRLRVLDGEDPEEILLEEGLELDYGFELI